MSGGIRWNFPTRDIKDLYAFRATVECATSRDSMCVPCAYKICAFDVAQDQEFVRKCPNQRPEMCPRERGNFDASDRVGLIDNIGYSSGMAVLSCGDGDFSFSLAIARMLFSEYEVRDPNVKNEVPILIASSYESEETLVRVYPGIGDTIKELKDLGANVLFEVDATKINKNMKHIFHGNENKLFDRIIWNFPCTAIGNGQDGQNQQMEENKELVRKFVRKASKLLTKDGEIHMCHKTKPPYNQWKIEEAALDGFADKNSLGNDFIFKGRVALDRSLFPPYKPRKALDKKSFSVHDAAIYVFGWKNEHTDIGTIPKQCYDDSDNTTHNTCVVEVTFHLIDRIRRLHENSSTKERYKRRNSFVIRKDPKRLAR